MRRVGEATHRRWPSGAVAGVCQIGEVRLDLHPFRNQFMSATVPAVRQGR